MRVYDPREGYLSLISLEKSRINLSPPIVFLFGGVIDPPKSVRGILRKHIRAKGCSLSKCLVIPEDFPDWLNDAVYPDLLSFESDLAQTSSLIIIAPESAGSIAELGAFSVNEALKNKIIIIISQYHHEQESFIVRGPLRQLNQENIYSYPYNDASIGKPLDDNYLDHIVENINDRLRSINKTEKFDKQNNGHVALLIYDLLLIFRALKLGEIVEYLKLLSCERDQTETKRLLFLLIKLSFLDTKRMGNIDYFIPLKTEQRIKFSSKNKSKQFDRDSTFMGTNFYYVNAPEEKMRRCVIKQIEGH